MRLRLLACALLALATAACAGSAEPEGGFGDPAGLVGRDVVDRDGRFVGEVRAVLVQDFNIISHAMVETGRRDINRLHAAAGPAGAESRAGEGGGEWGRCHAGECGLGSFASGFRAGQQTRTRQEERVS